MATWLDFLIPIFSRCFFYLPWVPEVLSSFAKAGTFSNRERSLFYPRNFENGPLEPGYFLSWHLKLLTSEIELRIYWFVDTKNFLQFCYRSSWDFSPFWLLFFYLHPFWVKSIKPSLLKARTITLFCFNLKKLWLLEIIHENSTFPCSVWIFCH